MKHSKSMAYLRQLCCLGLGKDTVIPEFLDAVRDVIPSNNNLLTRLDENGVPVEVIINLFLPDIISSARRIASLIYTSERVRLFNQVFKINHILTEEIFYADKFCRNDFYHLVLKPCEQHYYVLVPIYLNRKIVEVLWLCRPISDKPFNKKEQKLGAQLSPYLNHALQKRPDAEISYADGGLTSLLIANTQGEIVYLGQDAERLLTLATQLQCFKGGERYKLRLPPALVNLCRNLDGIFRGQPAMPPSFTLTNPRGRFVFSAYWLNKLNREPGKLIGITIQHQEPQDLVVMRALKDSGLSPVQQQVCLCVTQGLSNEQIGKKLSIRLSTVKDHVHKILTRLSLQNRNEIVIKLLDSRALHRDTKPYSQLF